MKKVEKDINSLSAEVHLVQMRKFINDFDNVNKKENKKMLKRLIFIPGPFLLGIIGFVIFKNPMLIVIGGGAGTVGIIITQIIDLRKEFKKIDTVYKACVNQDLNFQTEEKDIDQVLQEGIGQKKDSDFYTERYRQVVEELKQDPIQTTPKFKIIDNNQRYLDKDETMIQIVKEIDAYCMAYKLPPLTIRDSDWDCLFENLYRKFTEKGIESKFYDSMSEIGRFVFAKILVNNSKSIGISDFISNLNYLESYGFDKDEIPDIQQKILSGTRDTSVANFSDYVNQNDRKK